MEIVQDQDLLMDESRYTKILALLPTATQEKIKKYFEEEKDKTSQYRWQRLLAEVQNRLNRFNEDFVQQHSN